MWDQNIYVRKLYNQELGFRRGRARKAGRYFFISKAHAGYFPPLSGVVKNDYSIINIIPPFSNNIVMASYKYHNSKIAEGKRYGRDEYRLYLNTDIDPDRDFYKPGDIVALHRFQEGENIVYKIYHFPIINRDSLYNRLEALLQQHSSTRAHSHALILLSELSLLRSLAKIDFSQKHIPQNVQQEALRGPILSPVAENERETITRRVRSNSFRDLVLFFYEYKCAVTENVIMYGELYNVEAAHIIPRDHRGQDFPKNGIALSRDMHWAFDKGFFTISDEYEVLVHKKVSDAPLLTAVKDKKIFLPQDRRAWPSEEAIHWHQKNIFGLFCAR